MSASIYNNPYTYRPQQPRIEYPRFFFCCSGSLFRHILDSKLLALAVLLQGVALLVVMAMVLTPFWFQLVLDPVQGTFGTEPVQREMTINAGIFYIHETDFDNSVFLNKYSNQDTVPKLLQGAQVLSVLGACLLICCFAAGFLLMIRRFSSSTALYVLAGASTLAAASEVGVVVLSGIMFNLSSCDPYDKSDCSYKDNLVWRMIPIYKQFPRLEPHLTPYVKPNWAYYIAIIGAGLCIAAAVILWIEGCMTYNWLKGIRYQQLRQHRDPYEKDFDPFSNTHKKFRYAAPVQYAPNVYGMQPVVQAGYYEPMAMSEPTVGFGPSQPMNSPVSPPHGYGPPSVTSSTSGAYISREIDL